MGSNPTVTATALARTLHQLSVCGRPDLHFLQDLAHGTAAFNIDLLAAYGAAPTSSGSPWPTLPWGAEAKV